MTRIKMHAIYDHFPEHNPVEGEPYIDCYSDTYVTECKGPGNNIALMLEPRSMIGTSYDYVMEHSDYFKYIFTHDSQLLTLPQSRLFTWGDVWLQTDSVKDKGISLVTSSKNWCHLHNERLRLANFYKDSDKVDVFFGDWNNPNVPEIKAADYLEHYKFSIIIENDIDDYWYTEKILNCFATKTIPIYVGATKIDELFNPSGIIFAQNCDEVISIVDMIRIVGLDTVYERKKAAIEDNYNRIEPYKVKWKERFFRDYEKLLEEMLNG